jgi:serine/threonine-protein kinase
VDEFPTLSPGTLVAGKLRIVRTLGIGGMGAVYEVEHEITKHRRALKILHRFAAEQPSVVERFLREASAAGRVGNAHVAETFDAGTLEGGDEPYLLMELLVGETLDHLLQRKGPLDVGRLSDLVSQACDGVQAAHDAGIVHRDLKPENLMIVTKDGAPFVKIFDFGISKFDAERTGSLKLTTEGLVMGTPYYMSPEQVRGSSAIDARTDIYALGVILYECACGARPFEAATIQHLAVLIHEGKPTPLAERRPSLPPAFYDVVNRAMASDPAARFESARALASALAPLRTRISGGPVHYSDAPRVVVAPTSQGVPRVTGASPVSGPMPSTDAALAATMAPTPAHTRKGRSVLGAAVAALALAVTGVGAYVMRPAEAPSISKAPAHASPVVEVSATGAAQPTAQPRAANTALPSEEASSASAAPAAASASAAQSAEPARRTLPLIAPTTSVARTSASASATTSMPPAASAAKARVEDNGLSRDNPFR